MPLLTLPLQRNGPVIELFVSQDPSVIPITRASGIKIPEPESVRLLVDTGATMTKIERSILQRLRLVHVAVIEEHTASTGETPVEQEIYSVTLFMPGIPNGLLATELRVTAAKDLRGLGVNGLLGRDILDHCHVFYNGPEGLFSLAFEPPHLPS